MCPASVIKKLVTDKRSESNKVEKEQKRTIIVTSIQTKVQYV